MHVNGSSIEVDRIGPQPNDPKTYSCLFLDPVKTLVNGTNVVSNTRWERQGRSVDDDIKKAQQLKKISLETKGSEKPESNSKGPLNFRKFRKKRRRDPG